MRFLYIVLKICLSYAMRLFYKKQVSINRPKQFFGSTIYVSNHAASFMDPLVIAVYQNPIVFFMTRSDVFKSWLQPILWMSHMLPIYRQQDGENTKAKNDEVFKKCAKILTGGRNLLIFGEGFTDDVFIRRLKPLKKGAVRIGFDTLESINWSKKIYIAAVGVNYGDPNYFRSEILISNSERICLNDYKEEYLENPNKVITDLTKNIETLLQEQLTHVENEKWVFFHEHVSRIFKNGLHPDDADFSIPLKKRWENSRKLARWMNEKELDKDQELFALKEDLTSYFAALKKKKISDDVFLEAKRKTPSKQAQRILSLLLLFPFVPIGFIHFYLPYRFVKNFAEKTFKRRVFWSSIKMTMGMAILGIFNIPLVWALYHFFASECIPSYFPWIYFFLLPLFGLSSYYFFLILRRYKQINSEKANQNETELLALRNRLENQLEGLKKELY